MRYILPMLLLSVIGLSSCATNKMKYPYELFPPIIQNSYDYKPPVEMEGKGRPVWMTPVINVTWEKARVNPETGQWEGGRYVGSIVEEGRWAAQDEAELAYRPYIIAGTKEVVNPIVGREQKASKIRNVSSTDNSGTELDISAMQNEVSEIRKKVDDILPTPDQEKRLKEGYEEYSKSMSHPDSNVKSAEAAQNVSQVAVTPLETGEVKIEVPVMPSGESISVRTPRGNIAVVAFEEGKATASFLGNSIVKDVPAKGKIVLKVRE